MAAGLGFKTFTTGEVLTAADTNGYLMQGVLVFASSAARAAAITSPQEGQYSYLKDTNSTEYYDGAAWIAAPIGDITGVTAGTGISGGGTSGTVTITNSMATEIAAKGDLIVGTGAATFDNLTVGANGTTLVADSSTATGLKWAAPASPTFVGASIYASAQTVTKGVYSKIAYANEDYDTNGFHDNSTNNTRMTIPTGYGGKYLINAIIQMPSSTDFNAVILYKNGALFNQDGIHEGYIQTNRNLSTQDASGVGGAIVLDAVATDYFEIAVYLTASGTTTLNKSRFDLVYLGA